MPRSHPHKTKSGVVHRVQYRINGAVVTDTFATQKAGDEYGALVDRVGGAAARDVLKRRRETDMHVLTVREWTEKYLDPASGIVTGIQPSTRKGYERIAAASFVPMLGEYPIDTITRDDIGRWIAWQEAQPSGRSPGQLIAAKTVNNYQALLSNIFEAAKTRKMIPDNPVKGVRVSQGQSREGVFLTPSEFARILERVPEHYKPLVVFLVNTGCRWGEATALTWGDITFGRSPVMARINKAWKKGVDGRPVLGVPKSRKSRREVPLNKKVLAYLPAQGKPDSLVFAGVEGGRLWYGMFNTRIWKAAVTKADIGKSPNIHDLRHTYASWLLAGGAPLNVVQAKLGHKDISTTVGVYGHLAPGADDDVANVLDAAMRAVPDPVLELEA